MRVRHLKKLWDYAYINWLKVGERAQEILNYETRIELSSHHSRIPWLDATDLGEMAPCCFYRQDDDFGAENPIIFGIDRNYQLRRKRGIRNQDGRLRQQPTRGTFVQDPIELDLSMAHNSNFQTSDTIQVGTRAQSGCYHHFACWDNTKRTLEKFKGLDQTGVINAVCRHGQCIRLINLYCRERFSLIVHFIKSIITQLPSEAYTIL